MTLELIFMTPDDKFAEYCIHVYIYIYTYTLELIFMTPDDKFAEFCARTSDRAIDNYSTVEVSLNHASMYARTHSHMRRCK